MHNISINTAILRVLLVISVNQISFIYYSGTLHHIFEGGGVGRVASPYGSMQQQR